MKYKAAIITASDSGYAGNREDLSGPAARELLEQAGFEVVHYVMLPDDRAMLSAELAACATRMRRRWWSPPAALASPPGTAPQRPPWTWWSGPLPASPSPCRAYSARFTDRAMLSRAAAGIRKGTLIVNLPGSPGRCGNVWSTSSRRWATGWTSSGETTRTAPAIEL